MAGALIPVWRMAAYEDGAPAPGALLYTWLSGTSTPQAVYADLALGSAHTNPVEADSNGIFPIIYLAAVNYRMELRNADGDVIFPAQDNIQNLAQFLSQGVTGPGSSTNNAIARWDGTLGDEIQNSGITIADGTSGTLAGTNSGDVTLTGTPDYITISGQLITRNPVDLAADVTGQLPVANGGTGSTTGAIPIVQTTTATGTQADFALSSGTFVHLRCTGAAPSFSGFAGGSSGRTVLIECLGTTVTVTDQDSGSSAANQVICPTTAGIVVGLGGWILLAYDPTTTKWRANQLGTGGSGGLLQVPAGQIAFPSTQIPSADPNVLDDYEGPSTWTPTIISSGGGEATYTTQVGRYVKVGSQVTVSARIKMASDGTMAAGNVSIGGFPFTSLNVSGLDQGLAVGYIGGMTAATASVSVLIGANSTQAALYRSTGTGSTDWDAFTLSSIDTDFEIVLTGTYIANA